MSIQLIQDLGGRGEKLLKENLSEGEEIKVKLKGQSGQGFIVTNKRLYVLKWGFMAGNTFGGRVNAFEFSRISGIEIKKSLLTGTVEILTPANSDQKYGGAFDLKAIESDSAIKIYRKDYSIFLEAVKIAREMISGQHIVTTHLLSEDVEVQLEKLAQLKEKKLITDEEFTTKRAKILGL